MPEPPKPISAPRTVRITGCVIPSRNDRLVLLEIDGAEPDLFLPVFSTSEKLQACMAAIGAEFDAIKRIDDSTTFLADLPHWARLDTNSPLGRLRVIIDLRHDDRLRFTELLRDSA